jgi:hypothetical protein
MQSKRDLVMSRSWIQASSKALLIFGERYPA